MRILVTGGAGYVGSVSVEALVAAGHEVVVLDDLSKGHRAAVTPGATLVEGSYGDAVGLRSLLAAHPVGRRPPLRGALAGRVSRSPTRPLYYRQNVAGGVALLEALREAGVRRLVFSSTAAVYGEPRLRADQRRMPLWHPINPYGETKRTFEGALRWYAAAYGLRSVSLRYFNVAGASERNGEVHDPETHLVPNLLAAVESGAKVTIFGDDYPTPDGTCIRDYIHVEDLAHAHLLALEATAPGDERTAGPGDAGGPTGAAALALNLGNGGGFSVRDVLAAVETTCGRPVPHRVGPRREGDPPVLVADAGRARDVLGWRPARRDLGEIVATAWAWRQRHPSGYPSLIRAPGTGNRIETRAPPSRY